MELIIFTDLDGTLLNQEDYDYKPALPALEELKARQIPVVPVTSKTRQEVEALREALALSDPFIVENGSAVFVPLDSQHFVLPAVEKDKGYYLKRLGCTYAEARQGLKAVAAALGEDLRGFGDLTEAEIERLTRLPLDEVKRAKAREFTEPFITPRRLSPEQLKQAVLAQGFRVVVGDRFSHLIGAQAGKGRAVKWLEQLYQGVPGEKLVTVGLGNSPNDLEMLETVDFPIIIPGGNGPHPGLAGRGWEVASVPGSQGWAEAVAAICAQLIPRSSILDFGF